MKFFVYTLNIDVVRMRKYLVIHTFIHSYIHSFICSGELHCIYINLKIAHHFLSHKTYITEMIKTFFEEKISKTREYKFVFHNKFFFKSKRKSHEIKNFKLLKNI